MRLDRGQQFRIGPRKREAGFVGGCQLASQTDDADPASGRIDHHTQDAGLRGRELQDLRRAANARRDLLAFLQQTAIQQRSHRFGDGGGRETGGPHDIRAGASPELANHLQHAAIIDLPQQAGGDIGVERRLGHGSRSRWSTAEEQFLKTV